MLNVSWCDCSTSNNRPIQWSSRTATHASKTMLHFEWTWWKDSRKEDVERSTHVERGVDSWGVLCVVVVVVVVLW